jgi:hypothetical protein
MNQKTPEKTGILLQGTIPGEFRWVPELSAPGSEGTNDHVFILEARQTSINPLPGERIYLYVLL